MGSVSKADLVNEIKSILVEETPRYQIEAIVNIFLHSMTEAIRRKRRVEIRGFGSFSVRPTKGRTGRNPKTGEAVEIEPGFRVHFRALGALKEAAKSTEEID